GVLDYYLLLPGEPEQGIWPKVSYHEWQHDGIELRAKAASMTLAKFEQAASGELLDTTIWARFVQPSALIWCTGDDVAKTVVCALSKASATAARLAAVLGPPSGIEDEYWTALFKATYGAEFRIETQNRARSILDLNRNHFEGLLPLALDEAGTGFENHEGRLAPSIGPDERSKLKRWWSRRRMAGKPINLLRLVRAASTFEGASRYAAWKIERHTGIRLEVTPWREKHPVLAAPGVLVSIWRKRRKARRTSP
ncbi:MAG: hypothetical protein KUG65_13315, partial [Sphingomonadaceae bacterium]|nr:hypothetical protein [Sphingomonadaceae bacterium]